MMRKDEIQLPGENTARGFSALESLDTNLSPCRLSEGIMPANYRVRNKKLEGRNC